MTDSEGNELVRLEANIVINEVKQPIDVSMVRLEGITVDYDGESHSIYCNNVPEGVTVTYEGNGVSEVGTHKVVAIVTDSEGNELIRLEANIVINNHVIILYTPELSIDEFGNVTWDAVEGATHYNYIINDGEVLSTTSITLTLANEQTVSVQAANDDTVSEWSYAVTCYETTKYEEAIYDIYVKFHNTSLSTVKLTSGSKVEKPADPVKNNYTFDNWYADPFYQEVFDFNQELYSNTIIYANYIPNDLVSETYFWVKGDPKMTASVMSSGTGSNWHFIPLSVNAANTSFKEFYITVQVTGASSTNPCAFLVMDGFSDDSGRTYWKNNGSDFTINSDGVYNIYFSTEHQYAANIHVYIEKAANQASNLSYNHQALDLDAPVVSVDGTNNTASWTAISGASSYEVIIDNKEVITTTALTVDLAKGSFITVRAVTTDGQTSRWSLPKANIKTIIVEDKVENYSVYFVGYDSYLVTPNSSINDLSDPSKEGYTFGGWYLDYSCTTPALFPYTVTANTVFYPKWIYNDSNYETKTYYNLVTENGTIVKGFTWNLDNYTFLEYESGNVTLTANTNYYVVSVDDSTVKYGPYKVNTTGGYKLYFSEDNLWDGQNIYIAATTTTIYITNNKGWTDTIYVYLWNSSSNSYQVSWPGVAATYVETNSYNQAIYKVEVDLSQYDMMVISHGTMTNGSFSKSSQTIDLKLSDYTTNGFYFTEKNTEGKYQVETWNK